MKETKTVFAYLDGVLMTHGTTETPDVVQAALDSNITLAQMKKKIVAENKGKDVIFEVASTPLSIPAAKVMNDKTKIMRDAAGNVGFPEFLQDSKIVKQQQALAQAEMIDMGKLSSQLDKTTGYIRKEVGNVAKSFCRIGFKLWEAREQKQYLGQGHNNIYEYGEKVLGFKKATTASYISVCERFSDLKDGKPTANMNPKYESYSYTQLAEMLPLPDDKLSEVTPDMACKIIRGIKKALKGSTKSSGEQAEQATLENDEQGEQSEQDNHNSVTDLIFDQEFTGANAKLIHDAMFKYIGYEIKVYIEVGRFLYGDEKTEGGEGSAE